MYKESNEDKEKNHIKYYRIFEIDKMLRNKETVTKKILAERFENSEKTILRDIEFLENTLRAPIKLKDDKYYYSEPNWTLPAFIINESDLFAMTVIQKTASAYKNTPIYNKIETVFDKLKIHLPEKISIDPAWFDDKVSIFTEPLVNINEDIFGHILTALRKNTTLEFDYQPLSKETYMKREVNPYHLTGYKGNWYMIGFCSYKKEIRTFCLSRIKSINNTSKIFMQPANFKITDYMENLGIYGTYDKYDVKIKFTDEASIYIAEREWGNDNYLTRIDNNTVILNLKTSKLIETARWVLSQGKNAVVLEPPELISIIKEELKETLKFY